jgi:CPA2 family monovalent cation:H+ antiporter-2
MVRHMNPDVHIVARAEGIEQMQVLHEKGVYEIVQSEFEAGIEIARQALMHLGVPSDEIRHYADDMRHDLYAPFYENLYWST